jgi:hypothetical protein
MSQLMVVPAQALVLPLQLARRQRREALLVSTEAAPALALETSPTQLAVE